MPCTSSFLHSYASSFVLEFSNFTTVFKVHQITLSENWGTPGTIHWLFSQSPRRITRYCNSMVRQETWDAREVPWIWPLNTWRSTASLAATRCYFFLKNRTMMDEIWCEVQIESNRNSISVQHITSLIRDP